MDKFQSIHALTKVVEAGGFAAAARATDIYRQRSDCLSTFSASVSAIDGTGI
jgi:hypothetical protein